jgi:hypothetical protein
MSDVKRRLSRNKGFAKGCTINTSGRSTLQSPRVTVSWPPDLLGKLSRESEALSLPFAEIVRRRVWASYQKEQA